MTQAGHHSMMGGKRLPYDSEVEYLESTGTQWIDTGYIYNGNSVFACDATLAAATSDTYATMFGAVQYTTPGYSGYNNGVFVALNNTVPIQARFGSSSVSNMVSNLSVQDAVGVRHVYELAARRFAIDDSEFTRSNFTFVPLTLSVYLFGANDSVSGNLSRRRCSLKVYSFKISENGILVHDYLPVRKGTTGELYDRVSGKLAERHGDFLYGSDKI